MDSIDIDLIIQGGARGADHLAAQWAASRDVDCITVPARWDMHGKGAGPIRNQYMIDCYAPDLVVALPGGRGTADMVSRAKAAGIHVVEIMP